MSLSQYIRYECSWTCETLPSTTSVSTDRTGLPGIEFEDSGGCVFGCVDEDCGAIAEERPVGQRQAVLG